MRFLTEDYINQFEEEHDCTYLKKVKEMYGREWCASSLKDEFMEVRLLHPECKSAMFVPNSFVKKIVEWKESEHSRRSEAVKKGWANSSQERRDNQRDLCKNHWCNPAFRAKQADYARSDEQRKKLSAASKLMWSDDQYREMQTAERRERWINEDYRRAVAEGRARYHAELRSKITRFEADNDCTLISRVEEAFGEGWLRSEAGVAARTSFLKSGQNVFVPNCYLSDIKKYCEMTMNGTSHAEKDLTSWVESLVGKVLLHNRTIVAPYELDIYIPSKNVAIEYDGTFWHQKKGDIDLYKTQMCQALGIRLIHVKDYDWINKPDVVKSILRVALGVQDNKVYARKCELKQIPYSDSKLFLADNHLHGSSVAGCLDLGLFYNGELVQVASFGKYRFGDKSLSGKIELYRLATKSGYEVVGGFSRLMKNACDMLGVDSIVSLVDNCTYDCSGYLKVGFEIIGHSAPSYCWVNGKTMRVLHKQNARRNKLQKLLGDEFREEETEVENMTRCGWIQSWDCGNAKLIYRR